MQEKNLLQKSLRITKFSLPFFPICAFPKKVFHMQLFRLQAPPRLIFSRFFSFSLSPFFLPVPAVFQRLRKDGVRPLGY